MKRALATLTVWVLCICLSAGADRKTAAELSEDYPYLSLIEFPENVITPSPEEDSGGLIIMHEKEEELNITGDEQHRPEAFWIRPNILALEFPVGSSCRTEYSVEFPEHRAHFLSGRKMEQTRFSVRSPAAPLVATELPGLGSPAFLVMAVDTTTAEAQLFSAQSKVRYYLRAESGETIPLTARQACLRDLPTDVFDMQSAEQITPAGGSPLALMRLVQQQADTPQNIHSDTPIPQAIVIQAAKPLSEEQAGNTELIAEASPESGIRSETLLHCYLPDNQYFQSFVDDSYHFPDNNKAPVPELVFTVNTPLAPDEFMQLFRAARIRIGGKTAETTENGDAKAVILSERSIRICPITSPPLSVNEEHFYRVPESTNTELEYIAWHPNHHIRFTLRLHGAKAGDEVEIRIPADALATSGLKAEQDLQFSTILRELAAQATVTRHRDGTWELLSMGLSSIAVTARYIPAEAVISLSPALTKFRATSDREAVEAIISAAAPPVTRIITPPQGISYPQSTRLNRKELCDGTDSPRGLYLLHLCNADSASPPFSEWMLLDDSNLELAQGDMRHHIVIYDSAKGVPIPEARVTYNTNGDSIPITNSIISTFSSELRPPGSTVDFLLIRSGADYRFIDERHLWEPLLSQWVQKPHDKVFLHLAQTDYLPGETVRVWGFIQDNAATTGRLSLQRLDKKEAISCKQINFPGAGGFNASIPLPPEPGLYQLLLETEGNSPAIHFLEVQNPLADKRSEKEILRNMGICVSTTDNRIHLYDAQGNILNREQSLHVELRAIRHPRERLDNGLLLQRRKEHLLFSGDISIPAHCQEGIPIPMNFPEDSTTTCELEISMKDSTGNTCREQVTFPYSRKKEERLHLNSLSTAIEQDILKLSLNHPLHHEGHGILLMNGERCIPLSLKAGQKELSIPLLPHEIGRLRAELLIIPAGKGDTALKSFHADFTRLPQAHSLRIQTETDRENRLKVTVTGADGKGTPARLYLFAVDKDFLPDEAYRQTDFLTFFHRLPPPHRAADLYSLIEKKQTPTPRWERMQESELDHGSNIVPILRHSDNLPHMAEHYIDPYGKMHLLWNVHPEPWTEFRRHNRKPEKLKRLARLKQGNSPLLLWEPELQTDANGHFSITIPRKPGKYQLCAIAVSPDGKACGQTTSTICITP